MNICLIILYIHSNFFLLNLNLEIIDFDRVEAQGGSIRIYVGHVGQHKIKKKR